ncbi:MAG: DNA repair protein RecN [Defluviitaleaceae bacterium]|nr:DNA repair protein RecN [Defluviitaleaceae bacterium]
MITVLRVKNVAIIEEVELTFGEGLNILTGETGTGKSILIEAINFLLGNRASKDFIRNGAETASVEGIISIEDEDGFNALKNLGLNLTDDSDNFYDTENASNFNAQPVELLITRSLNTQGRSTCRINGRNVTVGMLKEVAAFLVDIHGQHQHHSLLDANKHIILLDRFCGTELQTLKTELADLIADYREVSRQLKELQGVPGQREAQMEIWQFQADEISKAKLKLGEEEELEQKRNRLSATEKLAKHSNEALYLLYGGTFDVSSATDQIGKALQHVTDLARFDESKRPLVARINELSIQLTDIIEDLSNYQKSLDSDPHVLEQLESRLDLIYRLKKKYKGNVEDILAHFDKISEQLAKYTNIEDEIIQLTAKRREKMQIVAAKCNEMTAIRRKQSEIIQARIVESLQDLGMKDVQFAISIEKQAAFTANGNDKLEFMISPNVGETLKPLSQIASGGEMSRIMLALKEVMADVDKIGTLIFDEIDTGVSGRTAQKVAEKLTKIAKSHQILCITHLPQIAAMADKHFVISKAVNRHEDREVTLTSVRELPVHGTIQELARLIGGAQITAATIKAAEEMHEMGILLKDSKD